jgi:hypothetical protein
VSFRTVSLCAALVIAGGAGCQQYAAVQTDLVAQARRGVAMTKASLDAKSQIIQRDQALHRQLLDQAFDADVRNRQPLTPDWVIAHRKAYAAAIDGLAKVEAQSRDADVAEQRTLVAIDDALQRLAWLATIPVELDPSSLNFSKETRP